MNAVFFSAFSTPRRLWGVKIGFPLKASPGRGKLSPQVTDEGAVAVVTPHPSAHCVRSHPLPLLSLRDIFPRPGEICPQGVKAFALGQAAKVDFNAFRVDFLECKERSW